MKKTLFLLLLLFSLNLFSQQRLTLDNCYDLVIANYPLVKQKALLDNKSALDVAVISKEKLPQLNFNVQATYQSAVIEIPIPNSGIKPLNKDQYKATLSVNQLIYAGGAINTKTNLRGAALNTQQKQLEVNLYGLKKQINQLYFSILLVQEKHNLLLSKQERLQAKLNEIKSGIKNGVTLPTSDKIIEAELLKIEQQFIEIKQTKNALINTLSLLIITDIPETTTFHNPKISVQINSDISRPELALFQLKKDEITISEELLHKKNYPKLFGFATGGYGNPGLNPLDNEFAAFYIAGIKLNWGVFDWNATKKQRQSLAINKDIINTEAETFSLKTKIELTQLQTEITKYLAFIKTDSEIILLRNDVLKSAESQLRNGIITSSAYITELTNLYEDQNNLNTHKIQLLLVKANYNITKGQ